MKFLNPLTLVVFLVSASAAISWPLVAQNPPASTYQPGFWQPAARVDLKRPIAIKLRNETDLTLNYDLTTNINKKPEQLAAGEEAALSELPIPAYLLINPAPLTSDTSEFNLKYEISVDENNVVLVKIRKVAPEIPGDSAFNLHETGAIYIY